MCKSGEQCYEEKDYGPRINQLKRLFWMLMIWVLLLTLGLGACITFSIILHQGSNTTSSTNSIEGRSQLTSYVCIRRSENSALIWREKNKAQESPVIKIEEDGNYFLFLRVTLQSWKQDVNYTVKVQKKPDGNRATDVIEGHINEMKKSTGFMGIGVRLVRNTEISVICHPETQVDVSNTYFGLIRF